MGLTKWQRIWVSCVVLFFVVLLMIVISPLLILSEISSGFKEVMYKIENK